MAIYHFSAQIISRSQGRSSVAAAAYRAGERFVDERTGLTHDFSAKNDVLKSEILLPIGAPPWMAERELLWNAVENIEKRKDAQVAREINIALPKELTYEQNWELIKGFVEREFVDKGMVADINFHSGHKGQEEQPHAHVMLTLREIKENGFGQKARAWNDKALLNDWREHWADDCNRALARFGFDMTIDHRTLEAQGIDLEPQRKIGPKMAFSRIARMEEHQQIARRNGERILNNPLIALKAITRQQSTFTHQDLARFVNRHTEDETQFRQVYEAVKASPDIVFLGKDDKERERFTTQEMLSLETRLIDHALIKSKAHQHQVSLRIKTKALSTKKLSEEQTNAFHHLLNSGDAACLVGFAGTGKSYMLDAVRQAYEDAGNRMVGMALSGIAAQNLEGSSGIKSYTIANRLIHWEHGRERLNDKDIVVIDEAGMVGSRQLAAIMEEVIHAGAKIILVGDPEQLQAIEAGAAFRAILERIGFVEMTEIKRQKEQWQQAATKAFALNKTAEGLEAYEKHEAIKSFDITSQAIEAMIETWQETRSNEPHKSQLMLAYTRDDVARLNEKARERRINNKELGEDYVIETARGEKKFAVGERIYFLRNEKSLGVKNGTLGTIEGIHKKKLIVRLDTETNTRRTPIQFHTRDYNDLDYGYAATIHKAQGVTVDRSYVLASHYFDRHTTYVALSRHRMSTEIYWSKEQFSDFKALQSTLSRKRTKDTSLDYALNRGLYYDHKKASPHRNGTDLSYSLPTCDKTAIEKLRDERFGWEKLATMNQALKNSKIELVLKCRRVAIEKSDKKDVRSLHDSIKTLCKGIAESQKTMVEIQKSAPEFEKFMREQTREKPQPEIKLPEIHWLRADYQSEWNELRSIKNSKTELMVKCYDIALKKQAKYTPQHDEFKKSVTSLTESLGTLAYELSQNEKVFPEVEKKAPQLMQGLSSLGKAQEKIRSKSQGRAWGD